MNAPTEQTPASGIGRREAIRRAALLAGVALSPQWLTLVDRARPAAQALHLRPEQSAIVSAVADRILPRTDTPGAVDVGVPAFIDLLYGVHDVARAPAVDRWPRSSRRVGEVYGWRIVRHARDRPSGCRSPRDREGGGG